MKRYILFIAVTYLFILITSCDKIEPPYKKTSTIDTTETTLQKIYVEYFTGHRCVNCPTESHNLRDLKTLFGNKMIYISVHAGYFSNPITAPFDNDFRTDVGNSLDTYFGVTSISTPNALINRKEYEGNVVVPPSAWASAISADIDYAPILSIKLEASIVGSNLDVDADIKALSTLEGTYMVSAFIVEDSVVAAQKNSNSDIGSTPNIENYIHRYMLRASMNGAFGDTIIVNNASVNQEFPKNFNINKNSEWNTDNLYVICFVYDSVSDEVIQVEIKKFN